MDADSESSTDPDSTVDISTTLSSMESSEETSTEDPNHISPNLCKEGILKRFEKLVNQLSTGWKYHVANTDGIKDAWMSFEDYYSSVCQFTGGLF